LSSSLVRTLNNSKVALSGSGVIFGFSLTKTWCKTSLPQTTEKSGNWVWSFHSSRLRWYYNMIKKHGMMR
jgi:hypothetical protein